MFIVRDNERRSVTGYNMPKDGWTGTRGASERLLLADLLPYFFEELHAKFPPGSFSGVWSLPLDVLFGNDR